MAEEKSLVQRFAFGSNDISMYMPGTPRHAFFIGMPQRVEESNNLSRQMIAGQKAALSHLQRVHSDNLMALNEIERQISSIGSTIEKGFSQMSDAIFHLEDVLCAELTEVKWILGQMDQKFAELIHLVKFPRETEARELIEDGVKALATGNLDDAERWLKRAVEMKPLFQAHMNLAFVFMHEEDAERAIAHFKKAADYAPESEADEARILALESLARAYFAAEDFGSARRVMDQALGLRRSSRKPSSHSNYRYATYCALTDDAEAAISLVITLCRKQPTYFAAAATDEDFAPVRAQLMDALDELARSENAKARDALEQAERDLAASLSTLGASTEVQEEVEKFRSVLNSSRAWLDADNYSDSVRALAACEAVSELSALLPKLSRLRQELPQVRTEEEKAQKEYDKARERLEARNKADDQSRREHKELKGSLSSEGWVPGLGCGLPILVLLVGYLRGCSSFMSPGFDPFPNGLFSDPVLKAWWWGIKWAFLAAVAGFIVGHLIIRYGRTMEYSSPRSLREAEEFEREKASFLNQKQEETRSIRTQVATIEASISERLGTVGSLDM